MQDLHKVKPRSFEEFIECYGITIRDLFKVIDSRCKPQVNRRASFNDASSINISALFLFEDGELFEKAVEWHRLSRDWNNFRERHLYIPFYRSILKIGLLGKREQELYKFKEELL